MTQWIFFGYKCQSKPRVTKFKVIVAQYKLFIAKLKKKYAKQLIKTGKWYQLQSRHIFMALPLFIFSTVGRGFWNEISKELVNTRITKYSKTAFAI
jgi:hypothetical protein